MSDPSTTGRVNLAQSIISDLRFFKNVILVGPPGTGKSKLLSDVRQLFLSDSDAGEPENRNESSDKQNPTFDPDGSIAFPDSIAASRSQVGNEHESGNKVFVATFHQGTKYRDFVSGPMPRFGTDGIGFDVFIGPMVNAIEHANQPGCESLVVIDEINRGPAVAIFGDLMTAIEPDKRLSDERKPDSLSWPVQILKESGKYEESFIPSQLYILAAMNQADTSVEPLDVAFLRRFHCIWINPNEHVLRDSLGLGAGDDESGEPKISHMEVLVAAWKRINELITLSRGAEYQIGHGFLMPKNPVGDSLSELEDFLVRQWAVMFTHISEVYFGDSRGLAEIVCARSPHSPYELETVAFAGNPQTRLKSPEKIRNDQILNFLSVVAGKSVD